MKSTTTIKVGKNQVLRPSGIVASKDGKYFYWVCSISGVKTFANAERFKTILERYDNNEKRLVKEFVCRPAQNYLTAGYKPEDIRRIATENKGKLMNLNGKPKKKDILKKKRKKGLKSFAVGEVQVAAPTATGSLEVKSEKIYPWTGNPDYFKSSTGPTAMSVAEATTDSCVLPARYLDDECRECPLYAECVYENKYTAKDWAKPAKNTTPKVTKINSFDV